MKYESFLDAFQDFFLLLTFPIYFVIRFYYRTIKQGQLQDSYRTATGPLAVLAFKLKSNKKDVFKTKRLLVAAGLKQIQRGKKVTFEIKNNIL